MLSIIKKWVSFLFRRPSKNNGIEIKQTAEKIISKIDNIEQEIDTMMQVKHNLRNVFYKGLTRLTLEEYLKVQHNIRKDMARLRALQVMEK